jgi:biopolymer transport protein TolQ
MGVGFLEAFLQAGFLVKIVIVILFFSSIYLWAFVVMKYLTFASSKKQYDKFMQILKNGDLSLISSIKNNIYSEIFKFLESNKDKIKTAKEDLEIIKEKTVLFLEENNKNLEKGIANIGIIASISPFVGLFGTVIGIIDVFSLIAENASVSLIAIGPGIAEALYSTALVLFVAVPASFFYNKLINKLENLELEQKIIIQKIIFSLMDDEAKNDELE